MPDLTGTKLYPKFVNRLDFYEAVDVMSGRFAQMPEKWKVKLESGKELEDVKLADGVKQLLEERISLDLADLATPPQDPPLPATSTPRGDNDPVIAAQNQERRKKLFYVLTMPGLTTKLYQESANRLDFYEGLNMMPAHVKLPDGVRKLVEVRVDSF